MRHYSRSYTNRFIAGRRTYRERLARHLLAYSLQVVDHELDTFVRSIHASANPHDPYCLFQSIQHVSDTHNWAPVCDMLGLRLSAQLADYFRMPVSVTIAGPVYPGEVVNMLGALYNESCITRSMSIAAEHLLSNVWGSLRVDVGSSMLCQLDLGPAQLFNEQISTLCASLTSILAVGVKQIRSATAMTLCSTIKEMNKVAYLSKYDRMLCYEGDTSLRLAAD